MKSITFARWEIKCDAAITRDLFSRVQLGAPEKCGCTPCLNFAAAREQAYPVDVIRLFDSLGIAFNIVDGDGKIKVLSAYDMRSRDADHFPSHVEQRAATAAGGYRRCDLHKCATFVLDGSDGADNAVRNRRFELIGYFPPCKCL